jgi:hypothetical protein
MNLLETYDSLLPDWRKVFSQVRTFERARRLTLGLLVCRSSLAVWTRP